MTEKDFRELRDEIDQLKADMAAFGTQTALPKGGESDRVKQFESDVIGFGETYFPHRVRKPSPEAALVTPEHREMMRLCDIRDIPKLILAYRGFAKSTWGTIIDTLHKIYYKKFSAGVIGSYDARTAVNNFTSAIFLEIETNPRLQQDFGDIIGSYRWSVSDFITKTGIRLAGRGVNEMVKGFNNPLNGIRLDLFKGDDLQKRESARSVKQAQSLLDWLWEEVYLGLRESVDGGSYFDILGTCVDGGTDAMSQMKDDTDRAMLKLIVPMLLDEPSRTFDTRDPKRVVVTNISEASGNPQWEDRYVVRKILPDDDRTSIEEKKRNAGLARYSAEMQQRPLSATHKTFRTQEWMRYLHPYGEIPVPNWRTHEQVIGMIDPSSTKKGDRKAIVILSSSAVDWHIYMRHVFLQQCSVEELFDAILEIQMLYHCQMGIEENTLKEFLWDDIKRYEKDNGVMLNLYPVHNSLNKDLRIKKLQSPLQRGVFVAQKGHSDIGILLEEAQEYPEGRFDDGLDAWTSAYQDLMIIKETDAHRKHKQQHISTGTQRPVTPVTMKHVLAGRR